MLYVAMKSKNAAVGWAPIRGEDRAD
jgi:hypothetical protein